MIPAFVTYKGFEKEDFLDKLGLSEHTELNLYNLLCSYTVRTGKSDVQVKEFVSIVNFWAKERNEPDFAGKKALDALSLLLEKLETAGFAIVERAGKRPKVFHLIDQEMTEGLDEDIVKEIEKAYVEIEYNPQSPFPSKRQFEIPTGLMKEIHYRDFNAENVASAKQWGGVIGITFSDAVDIACLPDKLDQILKLCCFKIHHNLVNNSDLFDLVYNGIRNVIGSKEGLSRKQFFDYLEGEAKANPQFWLYLSLVITKSKEKASQLQKTAAVNVAFYQSACLLYHYWKQEIESGRKEKNRESDEQQIRSVLSSKAKFYTLEDLGELKDEKGRPLAGKYSNFEQFLRSVLAKSEAPEGEAGSAEGEDGVSSLPHVIETDGAFIHKKAVLPLLFETRKRASTYLSDYFADCWREDFKLRYSSDQSVVSDEEFKKAVAQRIEREFPSLFRLLHAPALVGALLIENTETNKNLEKYHQLFFDTTNTGEIRFKDWAAILSLNREKLLTDLLSRFSFIQRFLIRHRLRQRKRHGSSAREDSRARHGKGAALLPDKILGKRSKTSKPKPPAQKRRPPGGPKRQSTKGEKSAPVPKARPDAARAAEPRPFDSGRMDDAVEEFRKAITRK
jgi:hypothetical protein